jgi:hypothetical protein
LFENPPAMSAAYPTPPAPFQTPRTRPASAGSAETLVLVALILQVLGAALLFVFVFLFFAAAAYHPFRFATVVAILAAIVGAVALLFLYFAYEYSYLRIQRGDYQGAQAPTLVIGILSLFLGLIPGILYLIGYAKLGDAIREQQAYPMTYGPAFGAQPSPGLSGSQTACRGCGRVYFVGQFPFCPNCGQKMGA